MDAELPSVSINIEAYRLLFGIENSLRELVITKLAALDGPSWHRRRLPGDVLEKVKNARAIERATAWHRLVPHHPIYYVDFPDLRKIIEQRNNWSDVFSTYFSNKSVFCGLLASIEPSRNAVAHNRLLATSDLNGLRSVWSALSNALGGEVVRTLAETATLATDLVERLNELYAEIDTTTKACNAFEVVNSPVWDAIGTSWWLDADYLQFSVEPIEQYFAKLTEYGDFREQGEVDIKLRNGSARTTLLPWVTLRQQ